jgi:hypothetical protein
MKLIAKMLGALLLQFLLLAVIFIIITVALWFLMPAAFPALHFGLPNAVALTGLTFLAKAFFVVK